MSLTRMLSSAVAPVVVAGVVAGCTASSPFSGSQRFADSQPQQLPPVQTSEVHSSALPPIDGSTSAVYQDPSTSPLFGQPQPGSAMVSADATGAPVGTTARDLSAGVTLGAMLGSWTVTSGPDRCTLNLTQTQSQTQGRYRASAPNCAIAPLALVSSWQLSGSQVQLYDASGSLIGALLQSSGRFIGTLTGGVGVSMVG